MKKAKEKCKKTKASYEWEEIRAKELLSRSVWKATLENAASLQASPVNMLENKMCLLYYSSSELTALRAHM